MLPLLARPKLLGLKNRWRLGFDLRTAFGRDIVLLLFSCGVIYAFYRGPLELLRILSGAKEQLYFPPALPLTALLLAIVIMLLFSNATAALGAFVMSKDLDMLLASPVSKWRFFWGKFVEVLVGSSWMVLVFLTPVITAFGSFFKSGLNYFAAAAITLPPFLVIPTAGAVIIVLTAARLVPANRAKEALLAAFVGFLWCIYSVFRILLPSGVNYSIQEDLLTVLGFFSRPTAEFLPSNWVGAVLGEALKPSGSPSMLYIALLYSAAIGLSALAFLAFRLFHYRAVALNGAAGLTTRKAGTHPSIFSRLAPGIDPQIRAVAEKDLLSFSRDISQAAQLILLLGLCGIYLYNFKLMHGVQNLTDSARVWWRGFLAGSNLFMGAFVITAVCSRFVFPSVSLEGQGFWIIQTAPIRIRDYLRAKFVSWLAPICLISAAIFAAGAFIAGAELKSAAFNVIVSCVITYGIVGLAVGLGGVFANFDWEHPSQLAASFGSLVFMLAATALIGISLIPAGIPILLRAAEDSGQQLSALEWWSSALLGLALLIWLNFKAADWALRTGEASIVSKSK